MSVPSQGHYGFHSFPVVDFGFSCFLKQDTEEENGFHLQPQCYIIYKFYLLFLLLSKALKVSKSLKSLNINSWYGSIESLMQYIYNIRTLSLNIKFICTSFRNRQNSEIRRFNFRYSRPFNERKH
jgi:hypothetical protein